MITENTADMLTVDAPWDTVPNSTSAFVVCYDVTDVVASVGTYVKWATIAADRDVTVSASVTGINVTGYLGLTKDSWNFLGDRSWFYQNTTGGFIQFGTLASDGKSYGGSVQTVRVSDPPNGLYDTRFSGTARAYGSDFTVLRNPTDNNRLFRVNSTYGYLAGGGVAPGVSDVRDCIFRHNVAWCVGYNIDDRYERNTNVQSAIQLEGGIESFSGNKIVSHAINPTYNCNGLDTRNLEILGDRPVNSWPYTRPIFVNSATFKGAGAKLYLIDPKFNGFEFQNAIGWFRHPDVPLSSDQRFFFARDIAIKTIDTNLAELLGVVIGLWDTDGNPAWTTGKNSTNYTPVKSEALTTDVQGGGSALVVVQDQYVNWSGEPNAGDVSLMDPHRVTSTYRPFTLTARKYGYIFKNKEARDWGASTTDQIKMDINPNIVATEATAAGYSSKFSIDWSNRIITVTGDTNPQEMYDYVQYEAAQSGNIQYDVLMTAVSPGQFAFIDDVRIIIADGGTLNIDDDGVKGTIEFGDLPDGSAGNYQNYIRIQNGGRLNVGTDGTQSTLISFGRDTTSASWLEHSQDVLVESGGTWDWDGGIIKSQNAVWALAGSSLYVSGNAQMLSESTDKGAFRFSGADTVITSLLLNKTSLVWFIVPNTQLSGVVFKNISPGQCIVGLDNDGVTGQFITAKGFDIFDPSIEVGYAHWDERWARLSNHADGTQIVVRGNLDDHPNNKGLLEVRQEIEFSAESGGGAKFYTKDTNNGSRLPANQIVDNPDYTSDREYTLTESGGTASYTTDGGILTGVYWRTVGGLRAENNEFDSRGINNDTSDIFTWMKLEYGQQPATQDIIMKGTSVVRAQIQSLPDLGITQATKTTVAAYTGISPVYSGGTLTVTVTENHTWDEVYDFIKYWEIENPGAVWENGTASFVFTANKQNYTYINLSIVVSGASLVMGEGQVLPTSPEVLDGGFFESANGAIWAIGPTTYFASRLKYSVVSGGPVSGVVVYHEDMSTFNRTYDLSLNAVDALTSDGLGVVEGYAVYRIESDSGDQSAFSHVLRARKYGYQNFQTTKVLDGSPIEEDITMLEDPFEQDTAANVANYTGVGISYE
jgi:hypothetical protein